MELEGAGDVEGLAWNLTASLMDFKTSHSIGLNYGRTDPGWLLSPQYRENEELFEIRYQWRKTQLLAIDVRGRWRKELDPLIGAANRREEFDLFVRFTRGFTVKK